MTPHIPGLTGDRAPEILAGCPDGCTEAEMTAKGFTMGLLGALIRLPRAPCAFIASAFYRARVALVDASSVGAPTDLNVKLEAAGAENKRYNPNARSTSGLSCFSRCAEGRGA